MKSWWLVIALLLSLGINLGIVAAITANRWSRKQKPPQIEEPLPPPVAGEGPQRALRLADRLGLEGEKRRQFIALQGKFFVETVTLRTDLAETQRELRRELTAEKPDTVRIETLLTDSARSFRALEQAMTRNVVESRRMLDADQEREFLRFVALLRPPGLGVAGEGGGQGRQPQRPRRREGGWEREPGPPRNEGPGGPEEPEAQPLQEGPPPGDQDRGGPPPPPPPQDRPPQQGLGGGEDFGGPRAGRPMRPRMRRWLNRNFGGGPAGPGGRQRPMPQGPPADGMPNPPQGAGEQPPPR